MDFALDYGIVVLVLYFYFNFFNTIFFLFQPKFSLWNGKPPP